MAVSRSIDFTKSSSNIALQPSLETVDLVPSIQVSVNIMREMHAGVAIEFAPLPASVAASIITDRHWLAENVLCLLSNAVKYSDGGSIRVSIALLSQAPRPSLPHSSAAGGIADSPFLSAIKPFNADKRVDCIRITVADHGIGVPANVRQHLFQPFSRAQSMAGGTGLGLYSLSKRSEALANGRCGVDERADGLQGSEFWFEFAYRPDDSSEDEKVLSAAALEHGDMDFTVRIPILDGDFELDALTSTSGPAAHDQGSVLLAIGDAQKEDCQGKVATAARAVANSDDRAIAIEGGAIASARVSEITSPQPQSSSAADAPAHWSWAIRRRRSKRQLLHALSQSSHNQLDAIADCVSDGAMAVGVLPLRILIGMNTGLLS
jgi:hypothetical protein